MNIGIIGGGQLGWMMINESKKLGYNFNAIDKEMSYPGVKISDHGFVYDQFKEFVDSSDVVTYEFEHVDSRVLEYADSMNKLKPGLFPIELKRDRSKEKKFLKDLSLPTVHFRIANSLAALEQLELPEKCIAKTAMYGYDGKGQFLITGGKIPDGMPDEKYVVEDYMDFDAEASLIASRSIDGKISFHAPSLNVNKNGMLLYNVAPFSDFGMKSIVEKLLKGLNYVGTMGVEFFIKDGKAYVNEFSPRVHNSGHHTLLGSSISQFEQHIRAITGLPIPDPVLLSPSGIINIIGRDLDSQLRTRILEVPSTQIYWYGKSGVRKRRKLGHVNVVGETTEIVKERISQLEKIIYGNHIDDFI
ncbi:MAG: 5-(carboxyamino)imidazole ribonucleotide synthase [Thermoplasmatales archaeon]|nr:5-(carboxyamino)imidazole ribonucleotide synthase [Thermoplasmatales archaeon]MCW6170654.1 5-(carboxyamino)imidazole ribonucleotide synthase [Thermoplasmatales archaeon]